MSPIVFAFAFADAVAFLFLMVPATVLLVVGA